jgi:hypothetical protein
MMRLQRQLRIADPLSDFDQFAEVLQAVVNLTAQSLRGNP